MRTTLLILMMVVFHTTPAFGQTATSTGPIDPLGPASPFNWVRGAHEVQTEYARLATSSPFQVVRDYLSGATTTVPSVDDIMEEGVQLRRQRYIDWRGRNFWKYRRPPTCSPRRGGESWRTILGTYFVRCFPGDTSEGILCSNHDAHRGFHLHCTDHLGLTPRAPILPPTHQRPYNPLDPDDRPYGTRSLCGFHDREDYYAYDQYDAFRVFRDYTDGCRDSFPSRAEIVAEAQYWCKQTEGKLSYRFFPL